MIALLICVFACGLFDFTYLVSAWIVVLYCNSICLVCVSVLDVCY